MKIWSEKKFLKLLEQLKRETFQNYFKNFVNRFQKQIRIRKINANMNTWMFRTKLLKRKNVSYFFFKTIYKKKRFVRKFNYEKEFTRKNFMKLFSYFVKNGKRKLLHYKTRKIFFKNVKKSKISLKRAVYSIFTLNQTPIHVINNNWNKSSKTIYFKELILPKKHETTSIFLTIKDYIKKEKTNEKFEKIFLKKIQEIAKQRYFYIKSPRNEVYFKFYMTNIKNLKVLKENNDQFKRMTKEEINKQISNKIKEKKMMKRNKLKEKKKKRKKRR